MKVDHNQEELTLVAMANNKCAELFGLSIEQTCLLYSLQRFITTNDIDTSPAKTKKETDRIFWKSAWLDEWDTAISVNLQTTLRAPEEYSHPLYSLAECGDLKNKVSCQAKNDLWKYLILLECTLYVPYYMLEDATDKEARKLFKERYKGVSCDASRKKEALEAIARLLDVDPSYISVFQKEYKASLRVLTDYWLKVAEFGAAGVIVALIAISTFQYEILSVFAAPGLSGAALVSSGLAALGGGALAAGGLGMAGGTAVLVGGGSLLGASFGTGVGSIVTSFGSGLVASEAAKQYVMLSKVIGDKVIDGVSALDIRNRIEESCSGMKTELISLKEKAHHLDGDKKAIKNSIKNLRESIKIMEKLLKRIRRIIP